MNPSEEREVGPRTVSVLIVDDQEDIRRMLSRLLSKAGANVVGEVATGEEAIEFVADNDPDVIVMDIQMPGIGGVEATAAIKQQRPELTIFGFTSWGKAQQDAILAAGATDVFDKTDIHPLLAAVAALRDELP